MVRSTRREIQLAWIPGLCLDVGMVAELCDTGSKIFGKIDPRLAQSLETSNKNKQRTRFCGCLLGARCGGPSWRNSRHADPAIVRACCGQYVMSSDPAKRTLVLTSPSVEDLTPKLEGSRMLPKSSTRDPAIQRALRCAPKPRPCLRPQKVPCCEL